MNSSLGFSANLKPYKRHGSERQVKLSSSSKRKKIPLLQRLLPLPWDAWPSEGRLLLALIAFWSVAGIFILGSASWWVANREMGDGAYYIKRQALWLSASWFLLYFSINTNLKRWLRFSGPSLLTGLTILLITHFAGTTAHQTMRVNPNRNRYTTKAQVLFFCK